MNRNFAVCLAVVAVLTLVGLRTQGVFGHDGRSHVKADLSKLARKDGRPGYRAYINPKTGERRTSMPREARQSESLRSQGKTPARSHFNVKKMPDGSYKLHLRPAQQPRERIRLKPGESPGDGYSTESKARTEDKNKEKEASQ